MIQFMHANLFDLRADVLVNPVNCVGVMGKGVALEFKRRYPEMFDDYREACKRGEVRPGKLHVWSGMACVVNVPTKRHWKDKSTYEDVQLGLNALNLQIIGFGKRWTVAMPALGCGNGGLEWARVKPLIETTLGQLPNTIYVCEP